MRQGWNYRRTAVYFLGDAFVRMEQGKKEVKGVRKPIDLMMYG